MNEMFQFLSTYGISIQQASLLGVGTLLILGLAAKKTLKRKSGRERTKQAQEIDGENIFNKSNYNEFMSMQTDDVNQFLIPREHLETQEPDYSRSPKRDWEDSEVEDITLNKKTKDKTQHSFDAYSMESPTESEETKDFDDLEMQELIEQNNKAFKNLSTEVATKEPDELNLNNWLLEPEAELNIDINPEENKVSHTSEPLINTVKKDDNFLNFDLGDDVGLTFMNDSPKVLEVKEEKKSEIKEIKEENNIKPVVSSFVKPSVDNVILTQVEPKFFTEIPTLKEPESVEFENTRGSFIVPVKPLVNEKLFPNTKAYHSIIEDALYWDSLGKKDLALKDLDKALSLIGNIRVVFYFKMAIQSYKNSKKEKDLAHIITQFYMNEREKIMQEEKEKIEKRREEQRKAQLQEEKEIKEQLNRKALETQHVEELTHSFEDSLSLSQPIELEKPELTPLVENTNTLNILSDDETITLPGFEPLASIQETKNTLEMPSLEDVVEKSHGVEHFSIDENETPLLDLSELDEAHEVEIKLDEEEVKEAIEIEHEQIAIQELLHTTKEQIKKYKVLVSWATSENGGLNLKNETYELIAPWGSEKGTMDLQGQLMIKAGGNHFSIMSVFEVKE